MTNFPNDDWSGELYQAAKGNDATQAIELVKGGAAINARNLLGYTAVYIAAALGCNRAMRALIDAGADINIPDRSGYTPLHRAASNGNLETVKALIPFYKSEPREEVGRTPLFLAVMKGHTEIARLLVANGADKNAKSKFGHTPFDIAFDRKNMEMIKLLR